MTTLSALQLQRELDVSRRTAEQMERPRLIRRWLIDQQSGRPIAVWTEETPRLVPTVMLEPAFA